MRSEIHSYSSPGSPTPSLVKPTLSIYDPTTTAETPAPAPPVPSMVTKDLIGASRGTSRDPGETVPPGQATRKDAVNILELTQNILLGSKAIPDAKLSLALVARVAWLRWVYETILAKSGQGAPKYWEGVDTRLADMRKQKNGDAEATSRVFGRFLNDDFALYGTVFVEDQARV
ncbi:hypothetical protein B0H14DRAFT_3866072 [Mycena olivaceomarginata]|nr:hypothetical protein B0H14DRAFT_3866072 [Mycena olivaceomarginata]